MTDERAIVAVIERDRRRASQAETVGSQLVGDLLDHLDVGRLDRKITVLMPPRAQIDDADVALAHAENVARDDFIEPQFVELGLCDRLHADGAARDELRERIVPLLDLDWDRTFRSSRS